MKKITKHWLEFAKKDLQNAKILFRNRAYEGSVWHCHQALEKYLKGFVVEQGIPIRKTHDLPTLLNDTKLKFSKEILSLAHELNAYYQPSRYPDTAIINKVRFTRVTTNRLLKLTETTIKWLHFQLGQKK